MATTETAKNRNGHKPKRPQTETAQRHNKTKHSESRSMTYHAKLPSTEIFHFGIQGEYKKK